MASQIEVDPWMVVHNRRTQGQAEQLEARPGPDF